MFKLILSSAEKIYEIYFQLEYELTDDHDSLGCQTRSHETERHLNLVGALTLNINNYVD